MVKNAHLYFTNHNTGRSSRSISWKVTRLNVYQVFPRCSVSATESLPFRASVIYDKILHVFLFDSFFCYPVSPTHVSLFMIQTPIISAGAASLVSRPSPFWSCPRARCVSTARKRSSHVTCIHVARGCMYISGDPRTRSMGAVMVFG